jgi:hypothetical protein
VESRRVSVELHSFCFLGCFLCSEGILPFFNAERLVELSLFVAENADLGIVGTFVLSRAFELSLAPFDHPNSLLALLDGSVTADNAQTFTRLTRPTRMPIVDQPEFPPGSPRSFATFAQHNRQEVALRNHTAKPPVKAAPTPTPSTTCPATTPTTTSTARSTARSTFLPMAANCSTAADHSDQTLWATQERSRRFSRAMLVGTACASFGFASLASTIPSALAAEPSGLPQAYSAKIVDTASLIPVVSASPPSESGGIAGSSVSKTPLTNDRKSGSAPVVSMLPVPSTKPDPAASTTLKSKKKAKKVVPPTTEVALIGEEAIALPAAAAKTSKVSDTKAPAEASKETSSSASSSSSSSSSSNSGLDAAFAALRKCESGGNYKINTGNGYYGAYQFDPKTWRALGYSGLPSDAAPEVQDEAARKLLAKAGWGQWPACSRKLGLR